MAINYPYRVFRYQVEMDGISRAGFSEVSGMNLTVDPIEYREGDDLRNTPRKLPGLTKFGNVTFRWGVSDDSDFVDWILSVAPSNTANPTGLQRKNITITLFDDAGSPGPSWNLINSWPVGYTVPDLSGLGGEIAIHSLEVAHEGLEHTPGATAGEASMI
ncbi:MAG: phage tail protein [Oscillospiraceae bacterium]|jgi:phage tail-like protein|nr:phage tail protein [Oscillospiraceae bacterium]